MWKNCFSSSSNSLFSIPVNQEFVFVEKSVERAGGRVVNSVRNIIKQCIAPTTTAVPLFLDRLSVEFELNHPTEGENIPIVCQIT